MSMHEGLKNSRKIAFIRDNKPRLSLQSTPCSKRVINCLRSSKLHRHKALFGSIITSACPLATSEESASDTYLETAAAAWIVSPRGWHISKAHTSPRFTRGIQNFVLLCFCHKNYAGRKQKSHRVMRI
jgi:hypothetical protein